MIHGNKLQQKMNTYKCNFERNPICGKALERLCSLQITGQTAPSTTDSRGRVQKSVSYPALCAIVCMRGRECPRSNSLSMALVLFRSYWNTAV